MAKLLALIFLALFALALAEDKKEDLDGAAGHHHGHHHGHHQGGHGEGSWGTWGWGWPKYDFGYKFRAGWGWH